MLCSVAELPLQNISLSRDRNWRLSSLPSSDVFHYLCLISFTHREKLFVFASSIGGRFLHVVIISRKKQIDSDTLFRVCLNSGSVWDSLCCSHQWYFKRNRTSEVGYVVDFCCLSITVLFCFSFSFFFLSLLPRLLFSKIRQTFFLVSPDSDLAVIEIESQANTILL